MTTLYPEYLNYNPCTIIINNNCIITNIQTKGLPEYNCGAHLESLEIISTKVGAQNSREIGTSGTVTITDYKNSVFDSLRGKMTDYLSAKESDLNSSEGSLSGDKDPCTRNIYLSTISIEIRCFTGVKKWNGWVLDWEYVFTGTTPSIQINWTVLTPTGACKADLFKGQIAGEFTKPKEAIKYIQDKYELVSGNIPIVDVNGNDVVDKLEFNSGKINLDLNGFGGNGVSPLLTALWIILAECNIQGNLITYVIQPHEDDNIGVSSERIVIQYSNSSNNTASTSNGKTTDGIVFVQNGSYPYYKNNSNNKCVIPMNSFNYKADMKNMALQSRVLYNKNGNMVIASNEGKSVTLTPDSSAIKSQEKSVEGSSGVSVSFTCYNVLSFSLNNIAEKISYEVYDEFGNYNIVSGLGTVNEARYSLKGGVVQADVTAVEYYNSVKTTEENNLESSTNSDNTTKQSSNSHGDNTKETDKERLIKQKDSKYLALTYDKTKNLIDSGICFEQINEFFDRGYHLLKGASRKLDWDYVEDLLHTGNIGLISLLYGIANYGIKKEPSSLTDEAVTFSTYKGKSSFFASDIGKTPLDYKVGGLGIAHWDSSNLKDIYSKVGFDKTYTDNSSLISILTTPVSGKLGKVSGWKSGIYKDQNRYFPIYSSNDCNMTKFDKGLSQNKSWLSWAESITTFKDSTGNYIYQHYLFYLWFEKFWFTTMKNLYSAKTNTNWVDILKNTSNGQHVPSLQDAVRIACSGNSVTSLVRKSAGKDIETQVTNYYNSAAKENRVTRRLIFCKRLTSLLEQCSDLLPKS